jgi:hypothetical protein
MGDALDALLHELQHAPDDTAREAIYARSAGANGQGFTSHLRSLYQNDQLRLVEDDGEAKGARKPGTRYSRPCLECGSTFTTDTRQGPHCSTRCRKNWNNRRMLRGAELYDLYMAHRFERERGTEMALMSKINRMVSIFREDDNGKRAGRRSWRDPATIIAEKPYLASEHLPRMAIGRGAKK